MRSYPYFYTNLHFFEFYLIKTYQILSVGPLAVYIVFRVRKRSKSKMRDAYENETKIIKTI